MPQKVWLLTSEYNDYDQHGEYFEAVFAEKPTREQLAKNLGINPQAGAREIDRVLAGGGRQDAEYHWYHLKEVELQ